MLIVEDDFALAASMTALLKAKGYEVRFAADGETGLELARKVLPDLVLLDVMIPKIGGFDVCRILRTEPKTAKVKVIIVTGLGRMGDVEKAFSAGAADYLIKPFDGERLLKKVAKVLGP